MTARPALTLVLEGPTDAEIMRAVLSPEILKHARFGLSSGQATLARNILVHEGGPVLVVSDADTNDSERARQDKSMLRLALSNVAPGAAFEVFAFVPEIEVIFFEAPAALEMMLSKPVPEELVSQGLISPKAMLAKLLGKSMLAALKGVTHEAAKVLRTSKQWRDMEELADSLLNAAVPE